MSRRTYNWTRPLEKGTDLSTLSPQLRRHFFVPDLSYTRVHAAVALFSLELSQRRALAADRTLRSALGTVAASQIFVRAATFCAEDGSQEPRDTIIAETDGGGPAFGLTRTDKGLYILASGTSLPPRLTQIVDQLIENSMNCLFTIPELDQPPIPPGRSF